mgnify:CR=1 FL=1
MFTIFRALRRVCRSVTMQFTEASELFRTMNVIHSNAVPVWDHRMEPAAGSNVREPVFVVGDSIVSELYRGSPSAQRASYLDTTVSMYTVPPVSVNKSRRPVSSTRSSLRLDAGAAAASPQSTVASADSTALSVASALPQASAPFACSGRGKNKFQKAPVVAGTFPREKVPAADGGGGGEEEGADGGGLIATALRRGRGIGSLTLKLTVYLPSREPMTVPVRVFGPWYRLACSNLGCCFCCYCVAFLLAFLLACLRVPSFRSLTMDGESCVCVCMCAGCMFVWCVAPGRVGLGVCVCHHPNRWDHKRQ